MDNRKINSKKLLPLDKGRCPDNLVGTEGLRRRKYLILILFVMLSQVTHAQCAMCRAVLESEENKAIAEGVNNGIVYLMAIPYIIVAVLFYFVYKKMKS